VTEVDFSEERCTNYCHYLFTRFGATNYSFGPGSLKTLFYCTFSSAKAGINQMTTNGVLTIDNDKVKGGYVRVPQPGRSVWSGTKFSFKTSSDLNLITNKIERVISKFDKMTSWKLPPPDQGKKQISYVLAENKRISDNIFDLSQVEANIAEIQSKEQRQIEALEYVLFYEETEIEEQKKIAEQFNVTWL